MKIFKILSNFIKQIKQKKKLFDSLFPGCIVWAKMPLSRKELKSIDESHRIRPYLVYQKTNFFIYAYQSSSKMNSKTNNKQEYVINGMRYKKERNSYVNLTKLYKIPFLNLKSRYTILNEYDMKNIEKRLRTQNNKNQKSFNIEISFDIGDIISDGHQLYYIYKADNVYLYCFKVYQKQPQNPNLYKRIMLNDKKYYINFKETVPLKRTQKLFIVNIAYQSDIEKLIKMRNGEITTNDDLSLIKKKEIEKEKSIHYESGTIFQIGTNKIVYLFENNEIHYGIELLMYRINPKIKPIDNIEQLQILNILPLDEFIKIVEFLNINNIQPHKKVRKLYEELRQIVYN